VGTSLAAISSGRVITIDTTSDNDFGSNSRQMADTNWLAVMKGANAIDFRAWNRLLSRPTSLVATRR
jgi:hypothetical protein